MRSIQESYNLTQGVALSHPIQNNEINIFFSQNLNHHGKNRTDSSICSWDMADSKIVQSDWPAASSHAQCWPHPTKNDIINFFHKTELPWKKSDQFINLPLRYGRLMNVTIWLTNSIWPLPILTISNLKWRSQLFSFIKLNRHAKN